MIFKEIPNFNFNDPYVFSSGLCRQTHFNLPLYQYWCEQIKEAPRLHRKQWEYVYMLQALYERQMLHIGKSCLGFGVGKEPLASYLASKDLKVLATDLEIEYAEKLGWTKTNEHAHSLKSLNDKGICPIDKFDRNVNFKNVDMNNFSSNLGSFDIVYSSCAFEHLGSIEKGLDFVKKSSKLLNKGGVAIHTTEFNLTSNSLTVDNNDNCVLFRKKDFESLEQDLERDGFFMEPIDFSQGNDEYEKYIDLPPYCDEPHIRLKAFEKFDITSIGIIVHKF